MQSYIISKEEIDASKGIDKTHFLNANAQRNNKSLGDLTGLTGIGFHLIEVQPGHLSSEAHVYYFEEECGCVYILEGTAEALIGETIYPVKAGDFIGYRAGGASHSLKNSGNCVLKCIVVGQRLDHDVADYPALNKRLYRNKRQQWGLVDLVHIIEPTAGLKK